MSAEHREVFESRLLALVRDELDILDDINPEGYEIGSFGVLIQVRLRPEDENDLEPWDQRPFSNSYITHSFAASYWESQAMLEESHRALLDERQRAAEAAAEADESEESET